MVRYKGKDEIEFGYKNYAEENYGSSPGETPTTLYRVGYVTEIAPGFDPELNRIFALRDGGEAGRPIALLSRRENVRLRVSWLQGQLTDYWQTSMLGGENFFGEAKIYRDASNKVYLFWTGLKMDTLTVRCSVGEPILWTAELVGKFYGTKASTIHSHGASPGDPWEWTDAYVQSSTNGSDWTTIAGVTDWELRVDNRLKPVHVFNSAGSKQLQGLEETERHVSARLTMNMHDTTYIDYAIDGTEVWLKLVLPGGEWMVLHKGKLRMVDPVIKPEDLIACRVEFEGRWLTHAF